MKTLFKFCAVVILVSCFTDGYAFTPGDTTRSRKPFVKIVHFKTTDMMLIRTGFHFSHPNVLGNIVTESEGLRFVPCTDSPEGLSEFSFKKHWWYNPYFHEVFIPYSDIKRLRGLIITRKDGTKIQFVSRQFKEIRATIKSNLKRYPQK